MERRAEEVEGVGQEEKREERVGEERCGRG
jgi:hypothetical protein